MILTSPNSKFKTEKVTAFYKVFGLGTSNMATAPIPLTEIVSSATSIFEELDEFVYQILFHFSPGTEIFFRLQKLTKNYKEIGFSRL